MNDDIFSPSWYRIAELKPQLRPHCRIHRHCYRQQLWYVLQNPVSGAFHRFSPQSYLIIGLLNGRHTLQRIWDVVNEKLQDDAPTQQDVIQLLTQLYRADVLQTDVLPVFAEMQERGDKMQRKKTLQQWRSPLSFKIPLLDPDRLLDVMTPFFSFLFTRLAMVCWLLLIVSACILAGQYWQPLSENVMDRALSLENLLSLWFVFPVVKILHELGHGVAVKHWGGEVHELGVMFLVFMPVPYVDASASTGYEQKHRRIVVAAAGLIVELTLAAIALLVWIAAEPGTLRAIAYNVMLIAGVSAVLFNGNPLLRFDSYYILADALEIPNLGARANQYIIYLLQKYMLHVKQVQSPVAAAGERGWLFFYAIASFCYRMVMMVSIILLIGAQYFSVGVLLACWSAYVMLLQPIYKSLHSLFTSAAIAPVRGRAVALLMVVLGTVAALLLWVPLPASVRCEGVVWAAEKSFLRSEVDGYVQSVLRESGARVGQGDALIQLEDIQVQADVDVYQAQYQVLQYRYQQERVDDYAQAQITLEEMKTTAALLLRAQEKQQSLTVRSKKEGVFIVEQSKDMRGQYVRRGAVLGYVLGQDKTTIRLVINQAMADLVRKGKRQVELRFSSAFDQPQPGYLKRQVPAAVDEIPSAVLTSEGGGEHVTVPDEQGRPRATQRMFQFEIETGAAWGRLGERVYITISRPPEPLGEQMLRRVRQVFLSRFDV